LNGQDGGMNGAGGRKTIRNGYPSPAITVVRRGAKEKRRVVHCLQGQKTPSGVAFRSGFSQVKASNNSNKLWKKQKGL